MSPGETKSQEALDYTDMGLLDGAFFSASGAFDILDG
jgi:hypothetical protein